MRTIRPINFGLALFCLFLSNSIASGQAPAQNQPTQVREGYCQAQDQGTIYFSDVFEINLPYNVITNGSIENLFEAYLKQSYGRNSNPGTPVVCDFLQSVAAAEEMKKQKQEGYTMRGKQLVETRWKLSRQQAATLAALPTTHPCYEHDANDPNCQQAPKTLYEVCRALTSVQTAGKYTTYFTDVMPRANINDADYSAAFAAFLAKNYGVQGVSPECGSVPSPAEGQKLMEEGWWKVNTYRFIAVHTGWTYSSASRPEPPAPAPAASSTPITSYTVCVASDAPIAYVSAAFAVTSMDNPAWTNGFTQFLAQNYSYKGRVGCNNMDLEHAPTFLKNRIAGLRANKKQVVETGWTYGSSATAPAATAAPAPPAKNVPAAAVPSTHAPITTPQSATSKPNAPPSRYAYCYSTDGAHTAYFSAPFEVADGDSTKWRQAFAAFLQKNYHAGAPPGCYRHSSLADAQSDLKKLQGAFPPTTKIVETRWEYKE